MNTRHPTRRHWLQWAAASGVAAAGLAATPEVRVFAQQVRDFVQGPPVRDIRPEQIAPHVWLIYAEDGFPTAENQGVMASVLFVVTARGVVVLDSGCSLQHGEMAIRMIRSVTDRPVVAVFNSHYHGDHWLGNHAFVQTYGDALPIHALPHTIEQVRGTEGNAWRSLMERWTNQATAGTRIVPPNRPVAHGQTFDYGDVTLRLHHHGHAHTPSDLCVEVVQDRFTYVGDIAMGNRIANMDDGSYLGTFKYYDALQQAAGEQVWWPGHGRGSQTLLKEYGDFMRGIWEPCAEAVKQQIGLERAKDMVLKDPRVASRARTMQGFESNIGKYTSLAYLEAERELF